MAKSKKLNIHSPIQKSRDGAMYVRVSSVSKKLNIHSPIQKSRDGAMYV